MLFLSQITIFLSLLHHVVATPVLPAVLHRASTALIASEHCGDEDYVILSGTTWIVYNMIYNADVTVGTQCTNFQKVQTPTTENPEVIWSSVTDIEYVEST